MHKLLQRQLKKASRKSEDGSVNYDHLLELVSRHYEETEKEFRLTHRSIELMSDELMELNRQTLEQSEVKIQSIVDNVIDGIITFNEDLIVETFNPAAESIFGFKRADISGQSLHHIFCEDENNSLTSIKTYVQQHSHRKVSREMTGRRRNGRIFPMEIALKDMQIGERRLFVCIVRDISERKKAETRLNELNNCFINFVSAPEENIKKLIATCGKLLQADCAVYLQKERDKVFPKESWNASDNTRFSPLFETLFRTYSRGNETKPLVIHLPNTPGQEEGGKSRSFTTCVGIAIKTHQQTLGTLTLLFDDFQHPSEDDLKLISIIASSIAVEEERRSTLIELERSKEKAESASRAKGEFLATISHELRTPMNAILGFTELLRNKAGRRLKKEYVDAIESSGKNLLLMINDILDLSKIESGNVELKQQPVNLPEILWEVESIFRYKAEEKGLHLRLEVQKELPQMILLDEARLRQVLVNLVGNAIKFTNEGDICIRAGLDKPGRADLWLEVEDSGMGIAAEEHDHIFEAFVQQSGQDNRQYGGTGLGLSITKRLVEMMNGRISVKSTPGLGSIFRVQLKNVQILDKAAEGHEDNRPAVNARLEGRILLIHKNISYRERFEKILRPYTTDLHFASSGQEGLRSAHEILPELIIMDIEQQPGNAIKTARKLRAAEKFDRTAIVAVGHNERVVAENDGLFDRVISDPDDTRTMMQSITSLLVTKHPEDTKQSDKKRLVSDLTKMPGEQYEKFASSFRSLEEHLLESWQDIHQFMIIDEILDFSKMVYRLGHTYDIYLLQNWASTTEQQTDALNIEEMRAQLQRFPEIVQLIKDNLKQQAT